MIKMPYNFVPLNEKVYYPQWSGEVSFNYPFSDGISGEIDIKIKAVTPVFVRDSEKDENDPDKKSEEFCHFVDKEGKKHYFIPGSSVKGMIRNIVEVISYSKIMCQDKKLSYRKFNRAYKNNMNVNNIYHGWLVVENGEWKIKSLGKVGKSCRISYKELERILDRDEVAKIKKAKEAWERYEIVPEMFYHIPSRGVLVFTGFSGNKKAEFVFSDRIEREYTLKKDVVQNFKDAYYLDNPSLINQNWKKLWSERAKRGERIPVFFQIQNGDVKHFGLSMLYKLPYKYSIGDLVKKQQNPKEELDFAQTLFGANEGDMLKGRVFASDFYARNVKRCQTVTLPLSTPRPTFYNTYLVQNKKNRIKTYDDKEAQIKGFKFYPPKKMVQGFDEICTQHPNICTSFKPLCKDTEFHGKIRFFNLKPQELGALISAINFFGKKGYYHKIGMAKAYGLGTVEITVNGVKFTSYNQKTYSLNELVKIFVNDIEKALDIKDYFAENRIKNYLKLHTYVEECNVKYPPVEKFRRMEKDFQPYLVRDFEEFGGNGGGGFGSEFKIKPPKRRK